MRVTKIVVNTFGIEDNTNGTVWHFRETFCGQEGLATVDKLPERQIQRGKKVPFSNSQKNGSYGLNFELLLLNPMVEPFEVEDESGVPLKTVEKNESTSSNLAPRLRLSLWNVSEAGGG